ncbi:MAG: hypothetical protein ACMG57_05855 [Candidatus Dojkabacteria bacterium]
MKIRVSADYNSLGLWDIEDGSRLNLKKIKISDDLIQLLKKWIITYSEIIDWSNPGKEKILSDEFIISLNKLEDEVFDEVKKELGKDHELIFKSHKLPLNSK